MLPIDKHQIPFNTSKRTKSIEYIVIHDSGNTKPGADDIANYNYFNTGDRQSSADFFVDGDSITQINDYTKNYTWAVGDGKSKYRITNNNSVSIEICVNSDGDYEKAVANTVDFVKWLMAELNLPLDRVVRHYDASRKNCPASMNNGSWEQWYIFKDRLIRRENIMITDVNVAINKLVEKGVINSPDYWTSAYQVVNNLDKLLINMANALT